LRRDGDGYFALRLGQAETQIPEEGPVLARIHQRREQIVDARTRSILALGLVLTKRMQSVGDDGPILHRWMVRRTLTNAVEDGRRKLDDSREAGCGEYRGWRLALSQRVTVQFS
jgi:hypothetical protein